MMFDDILFVCLFVLGFVNGAKAFGVRNLPEVDVHVHIRSGRAWSRVRTGSFVLSSLSDDSPNEESWQSGGLAVSDAIREGRQAGTDGYSVIRQPLSQANWDPNASPENEVPPSLLEDNQLPGSTSIKDEQWWERSTLKSSNEAIIDKSRPPMKGKSLSEETTQNSQGDSEMDHDLDLFERTYDTLDFPRVVCALSQDYVTTMPARNILSNRQPKARGSNRTDVGSDRAFQPFLSRTAKEARERYKAVEELQQILEGRSSSGENMLEGGYFYRNRKGYKEPLLGGSTPLSGNSFALEPILEAASSGGLVLESHQLVEISSALDQMQDIQSWGEALTKVTETEFVELPKLVECISVNETLSELLENALDKDGRLSGGTFPTVGRLRAQIKALRGDILQTLETFVQLPSVQSKLALESGGPLVSEMNGGRLVIPLQASDSKREVSSVGIVHDTSRSGKTVYV